MVELLTRDHVHRLLAAPVMLEITDVVTADAAATTRLARAGVGDADARDGSLAHPREVLLRIPHLWSADLDTDDDELSTCGG